MAKDRRIGEGRTQCYEEKGGEGIANGGIVSGSVSRRMEEARSTIEDGKDSLVVCIGYDAMYVCP
jgi:hypothetical protein